MPTEVAHPGDPGDRWLRSAAALSAALSLPLMFGVLRLFARYDADLRFQDLLFDFEACQWLVRRNALLPRVVFYSVPKNLFIVAAVVILVLILWPDRRLGRLLAIARVRDRRRLGFALTIMVLLPSVVAVMKHSSSVPCPFDVDRYCGELPHLRPFESARLGAGSRPARGGCFPAAHASGAFSLMGLFFLGRNRKQRLMLLAAALALGWLVGGYQMARGAHFLSHTVATMFIAWPMVTGLAFLFGIVPRQAPR